jgi:putative membrane protein
MMYYGPGMGGWGMTFMIIANLVFWGLLIFVAVLVARYVREGKIASAPPAEASPQQIAAQRFARGEITEEEYLHLLQILSGGSAEARKSHTAGSSSQPVSSADQSVTSEPSCTRP